MNAPFLLRPVGKDYLWGGSRLNDDFSKGIDLYPLDFISENLRFPLFTALQRGTVWDNKKFQLYIIIVLRQALPIILVGA